jgi:RNA polymerase sigma-70 factor (ECF subfamily)
VDSEQAFRRYVVPEIEVLLRVARSITRHQHDAEDLVQDTLLRAYRAIDRFDGSNPRAWLLTILRNANVNRNRRRRPMLLRDPDEADRLGASTSGGREPEQEHVARLLDGHLDVAVRNLPEKFRRAVELVDLAGLTYEDAAQLLDVPLGTVMSRVHRGRARLREQLRPGGATRSEVKR